jgi:large subunit ribosomal protein L11
MASKKKVSKNVKLQIEAGRATPAPPIGPAIGQAGVAIGVFVTEFNDRTKDLVGKGKVSVKLKVYEDRSYEFTTSTPLTGPMILKAAGIDKGSSKNATKRAGSITKAQVKEIAEAKMSDLYSISIENAMKVIEGQCRSMGIEVK